MKHNKGFIGIGVIAAIVAILAVGGGAVYLSKNTPAQNGNLEALTLQATSLETASKTITTDVIGTTKTLTPTTTTTTVAPATKSVTTRTLAPATTTATVTTTNTALPKAVVQTTQEIEIPKPYQCVNTNDNNHVWPGHFPDSFPDTFNLTESGVVYRCTVIVGRAVNPDTRIEANSDRGFLTKTPNISNSVSNIIPSDIELKPYQCITEDGGVEIDFDFGDGEYPEEFEATTLNGTWTCYIVAETVRAPATGLTITPKTSVPTATKTTASGVAITRNLAYGLMNDAEVKKLQDFLIQKGYLEAGLNSGNYLGKTVSALQAFQIANGIQGTGRNVGPATRNALLGALPATQTPTINPNLGNLIRPCDPTRGPAWIQVLYPNGGEVFTAGQQVTVKWKTCNVPMNQLIGISLEHVLANGFQAPNDINGDPVTVFADGYENGVYITGTQNDGIQTFTIPSFQTFPNGNNYRVTAFWWNAQTQTGNQDRSDNNFTINAPRSSGSSTSGGVACLPGSAPSVTVTSPSLSEVWNTTTGGYVKWNYCNIPWNGGTKISLINQTTGTTNIFYDPTGYSGPLNPIFPFSDRQRLISPNVDGWDTPFAPIPGQYKLRVECRIATNGSGASCDPNSLNSYFDESDVFVIQ